MRGAETSQAVITRTLAKLRFFTATHLRYEEALLRYTEYPGFEQHRQLHLDMLRQAEPLILRAQQNSDEALAELFVMLKAWWVNHICTEDQRYAAQVNAFGF